MSAILCEMVVAQLIRHRGQCEPFGIPTLSLIASHHGLGKVATRNHVSVLGHTTAAMHTLADMVDRAEFALLIGTPPFRCRQEVQ
jgi:hypothetical protein